MYIRRQTNQILEDLNWENGQEKEIRKAELEVACEIRDATVEMLQYISAIGNNTSYLQSIGTMTNQMASLNTIIAGISQVYSKMADITVQESIKKLELEKKLPDEIKVKESRFKKIKSNIIKLSKRRFKLTWVD